MRSLFIALLLAFHAIAGAEILAGINFHESLRMIKEKYPNANFEDTKAAWLQQNEKFIKISGMGLGKTIRVKLDGLREFTKKSVLNDYEYLNDESKKLLTQINNLPEDDVFFVQWVRTTPEQISTLENFKSVFGKPECKLNKEMQRRCEWKERALHAQMSDEGRHVLNIETYFTTEEKLNGINKTVDFYSEKNGLTSLSTKIRNNIDATKIWMSTVQKFITDHTSEIDYKTDKVKFEEFDSLVKLLANRTENSDKPAEWFLSEAHKMVKQAHGVN